MKILKLKRLLKVLNLHIVVNLLDGNTEKLICCATVEELLHTKKKKYKKYLDMDVLEMLPVAVSTNTYISIAIVPKEENYDTDTERP